MQTSTGTVNTNGVELFYETRGPEQGEPVVFVMGLSAQMVFWPEGLLNALAENGYRVIRFDNRDVGMSTHLRVPTTHSPVGAMARYFTGLPVRVHYTLHDMVRDTMGLLDALGHDSAHFVGASMGGMISQLSAIHYPERVRSLTSIMSSPNSRLVPPPKPQALKTLVGPRVRIQNVDQYVAFGQDMMRKLGGKLPQDADEIETMFRQSWERGLHPRGIRQQFMAIMGTGSFRKELAKVRAPATVIHGANDPLIPLAGGKLSARHIPGARLHVIAGMGHDLPRVAQDEIAESILETITRGQQADLAAATA